MIQLLTFDLDNTLWETETVVVAAEQTLLQWLDRHAPRFTQQLDGDARRALRKEVLAADPALRHRVTACARPATAPSRPPNWRRRDSRYFSRHAMR